MASVDGKIESGLKRRDVKQEVGSKPAPFDKPKPKGCATRVQNSFKVCRIQNLAALLLNV